MSLFSTQRVYNNLRKCYCRIESFLKPALVFKIISPWKTMTEDDHDTWLLSQILAVKHYLEASKRKEHQHAASELHIGLKNHTLIQDKTRIDSIVFSCAIMHNMLIDKWEDDDDYVEFETSAYGPLHRQSFTCLCHRGHHQ